MSVRSLNKVLLIGNLTRDPEVRYTGNGVAVASFAVATNRSWKDESGEIQEAVEFHNIVAWNKMAEICQQILAKGMMVYIEGSLNTRTWEGEDGKTNYKTEIRVTEMKLLDGKGKSGVGSQGGPDGGKKVEKKEEKKDISAESKDSDDVLEDDLPF